MNEDPAVRNSDRDRKVPCPECGIPLSPRGLAGHRRLKHGVVSARAERTARDEMGAVRQALDAITSSLDRLDRRMVRLEVGKAQRSSEQGLEIEALRSELDLIVSEIAAAKEKYDALNRAGGPGSETFRKELGRLRRRQAVLLFRLGTESSTDGVGQQGWGIF